MIANTHITVYSNINIDKCYRNVNIKYATDDYPAFTYHHLICVKPYTDPSTLALSNVWKRTSW